jgi:glycosyltransferase involved in cell wall biosynthesis
MTSSQNIKLSVIITAHSESILIHRTLASVRRALGKFNPGTTEIILHADKPTTATQDYLTVHEADSLKSVRSFVNHFGDLGASRNFAVKQARGTYVATIDADDIMSEHWLFDAVELLENRTEQTIAHSEYTVEFEGADSLVVKHGEIDYSTDTLLSVYANRWNSVIVAPRDLLLANPYTPNSPGFGYEDWNLNCRTIHSRIHNVLVPRSAIFVRRKRSNSEWARQVQSMSVLRANPLLAFDNIRSVNDPFQKTPPRIHHTPTSYDAVEHAKVLLKKYPAAHRIARYVKRSLKRKDITPRVNGSHVPQWLQDEWKALHKIDRQIFPTKLLMETIPVYDTITEDHRLAGSLYKTLVDQLRFDSYSYILFAPWLVKGGADKFTIAYANTIAELSGSRVLVVATLPLRSSWQNRLSDDVDFLDFGNVTAKASQEIKQRLMEHVVENSGAQVLHVINSEFGYDFIRLHDRYIKSSGKKVVVTSFSQSLDPQTGRFYGYSHTHVPFVYDVADIITSDNQAVINMWIDEYGFNPAKLIVHRQALDLSKVKHTKRDYTPHTPFRILWAGRIAPEKLPEVAATIGEQLDGMAIIDMYGAKDAEFDSFLKNLPPNVTYKGAYDGFESVDVTNYDALLYTSLFDGMPNVILEAAAAKLPIVASAIGGIPEFLDNHNSGIVIEDIYNAQDYISAIKDLLLDDGGKSYAQKAYEKLENDYSESQYRKSISEMLKELGLTK